MTDDVRHLGTIQGREVPQVGAPDAAVPPVGAPEAPSTEVAISPPVSGESRPSTVARARGEVLDAVRDIRDAHRRGPKPNHRELPLWVERLAWVLDDAVAVPGTAGRRVGIDGFITLVPGVGDAVGVALSMVVVTAGVLAGVSWPTIFRMLFNVAFEGVIGLIPFAGVVFDMAYKANDRNVRLIQADLADRSATRRSSLAVLVALVVTSFLGILMLFVMSVLGIAVLVWLVWRLLG